MDGPCTIIDADAHVLEPGDLWLTYMEARHRDRAPGLLTKPDGKEIFRIEEGSIVDTGTSIPMAFAAVGGIGMRDGHKPGGTSYYDGRSGGFDPHHRIPDMDREGVDAAFLYPSLGLYLSGMTDPELAAAACRAYNRWLADYCAPYPARLFGVAIIPMQSAKLAVEEIEFARKELGFRAGYIRPNPYLNRPLHHPGNDPVWQAAQQNDFAIAVHTAASKIGMPVLGEDRFNAAMGTGFAVNHCTLHTLEMMAAAASFIMCRICDRFPLLRVGFMESSGGWIAGWLDRMDRHFDDKGMNDTGLSTRPSTIFRRQCFISFEPVEGTLPLLADYIGRTNILWASDYPHSDGFTDAPEMIRRMGMKPDLETAIFGSGARRFYGLN